MNVYRYHNVIIEIEENPEIGEILFGEKLAALGYCQYDIPEKYFKKFKKSDEYGSCDPNEEHEHHSADLFISFVNWYNNYGPDEDITIKVEADHPYWVYHDLCHAKENDVFGCQGNIGALLERDRLIEGIDLWQKETEGVMSYEYKGLIVESFFNRFNEHIGIPFFSDWEEEMYAEWADEDEYIEEEQLDEDKY